MKKLSLSLIILCCIIAVNSIIIETGSLRDFLYGQDSTLVYDNYVSHTSEKIVQEGYNYYAPFDPQSNEFGSYITPTSQNLYNWQMISEFFINQDWESAEELISTNNFPYQIVEFHDSDYDRTYYMLRELLNNDFDSNIVSDPTDDVTGSFDYGWGLYIFNPEATNPIMVTVPCPNDNFISPVIGYNCFTKWDSAFLMIAGAGREVAWNPVSTDGYYNSISISDPSRSYGHTFNNSYNVFEDYIDQEYGRKPFSAQMNSYDWGDRHVGRANIQLSAGYGDPNPNLPIWDHSNSGQDLLNWSDEIIFPANTLGVHSEVDRNDYYAVFNQTYPLYYDNNPDTPVNVDVDMNCYRDNVQMSFANSDNNDYDVFNPFFHVLIDELPEAYSQTEENYKWFYGYDPVSNRFVKENIYTMTENYYNYWIDIMAENLDSFIHIDTESPTPERPTDFHVTVNNSNRIYLEWEASSDHNFKSYEILYSQEPIANNNYQVMNRDQNFYLADQKKDNCIFFYASINTEYYLQLRAVDYSGNSVTTPEILTHTTTHNVRNLKVSCDYTDVAVKWSTLTETGISGFKVLKRELGSENWIESSDLIIATGDDSASEVFYTWYDEDIQLGDYNQYKLRIYDLNGDTYFYDNIVSYSHDEILSLTIAYTSVTGSDTLYFGINKEATDYYDSFLDTRYDNNFNLDAHFYEKDYTSWAQELLKNIYAYRDLTQEYIEMPLRVRGYDYAEMTISLNEDISSDRYSRKVWLKTEYGTYIDLSLQNYSFSGSTDIFKEFSICYGNVTPQITLEDMTANKIYHPGETVEFNWSAQLPSHLTNYSLNLISATDSLHIQDFANTSINSYNWSSPQTTRIENAKYVIYATVYDGEVIKAESNSCISILPNNLTYSFDPGWHLVSHVWQSDSPTSTDLFGPDNILISLINILQPTITYAFGKGYWAYIPTANQSTNNYEICTEEVSVELIPGWNLLGNPYPKDISINSLNFTINDQNLTFENMINYDYISRGVYTNGEDGYDLTTRIGNMEGFFLYNKLEEDTGVTLTYAPNSNPSDLDSQYLNWTAKIVAEAHNDKDNFIIGISDYASDDLDNNYDFQKCLNKPYEGVDIYLDYENANPTIILNGQQDIKAPLSEDEIKEWSFIVNARTLEPITLSFNSEDFPSSSLYSALEFHGNDYYFDLEHDYQFTPQETGEHLFKLKVASYAIDNENEQVSPLTPYFNVYPNPFNPETNISFELKQESKVKLTVYNIKGQKVNTICNDILSPGKKAFAWQGKNNNGKQTASGIYFLKLDIKGEKSKVRKIMLMK